MNKKRRLTIKHLVTASLSVTSGAFFPMSNSWGKTYLSIDQAKTALLPAESLSEHNITLSDKQRKSIAKASKVRVRSNFLRAWKSNEGNWFIVDQIIGKHENIDIAFAISSQGAMIGLEILTYRESYGHEIQNARWRAQFTGKNADTHLKLDRNIKNISGATLSCAHVTDGVNRLLNTWQQVLSIAT